jgi:hypothetical protein
VSELSLNPNIGEYDNRLQFYPVREEVDPGEVAFFNSLAPHIQAELSSTDRHLIHSVTAKKNKYQRAKDSVRIGCVINHIKGTEDSKRTVIGIDDDGVTVLKPDGRIGRLRWGSVAYMKVVG